MPGKKIWKVQRTTDLQTVLSQTIHDGAQALGPHQAEEMCADMSALLDNFVGARASGSTGHDNLSALLANTSVTSPTAPTGTPAASNQPQKQEEGDNSFSFGFTPLCPAVAAPAMLQPQLQSVQQSTQQQQIVQGRGNRRQVQAGRSTATQPAAKRTVSRGPIDTPEGKKGKGDRG